MNILVSAFGCDGGRSGIGRYLHEILPGLASGHEVQLLGDERDLQVFGPSLPLERTRVAAPWTGTLGNLVWQQTLLPRRARGSQVLFLPAANRRLPGACAIPTVGTVHDLSFLHIPDKYDGVHRLYHHQVLPRLIRRLTHVITVSQSSKRDILAFTGLAPERVSVIPNGVDTSRLGPLTTGEAHRQLEGLLPTDRPYLVYVSRIEHPGKNHVRLIEAFARLKASQRLPHRLVLAGPDRERAAEVHAAAAASGCGEDILFPGFIPDDRLNALYAGAELAVYPSLYEGFGLPILESMACGAPVACADSSSLPEVAGDAADYFDPRASDSLAASLARLLDDAPRRQALRAAGLRRAQAFSWSESARQTRQLLELIAR